MTSFRPISHKLSLAFFTLFVFSLFIILWGAWVRISGSGDGCGSHWPFCHGEIIPEYRNVAMVIENFHRVSSKLFGFFVIGLWIYVFRRFKHPHPLRRFIVVCFALTLIEGLLGALLVIGGFVGQVSSPGRAIVMSLHLLNTFLLMASIALCWLETSIPSWRVAFRKPKSKTIIFLGWALILWVIVNSTGALAALASTLFPSTSLIEGLQKDFSSGSHFSLRLRIFHPVFAVAFVFFSLYYLQSLKRLCEKSWIRKMVSLTQVFLGFNLTAGLITLGLLSPTWMKLIHLSFTHLIWISLCLILFPLLAHSDSMFSRFIGRSSER